MMASTTASRARRVSPSTLPSASSVPFRLTSGSRRILRQQASYCSAVFPAPSTRRHWIRRSCTIFRARNLSDQALGAIHDHAQNAVEPTEEQLALIAEFQRTDKRFFSSDVLQDFASGGPAPVLPPGKTKSEQRGASHVHRDGVHAGLHQGHLRLVPRRSNAPIKPARSISVRLPVRASPTSASASGIF